MIRGGEANFKTGPGRMGKCEEATNNNRRGGVKILYLSVLDPKKVFYEKIKCKILIHFTSEVICKINPHSYLQRHVPQVR